MDLYRLPWRLEHNKVRGEGGREIDRFRGEEPAVDTMDGSEAWVGSDMRAFNATVDRPDLGMSFVQLPGGGRRLLSEMITAAPEQALGKAHIARYGQNLGVLIKLLDAKSQYTIQAHPPRDAAARLWHSPRGKEESWYILHLRDDAAEPPYIYLGFRENVSQAAFRDCCERNDTAGVEQMCHKFPVQVGDAFFIPGGMPHALGAGCLAVEVQEPSDLTVVPLSQRALMKRLFSAATEESRLPLEPEELYSEKMLAGFQVVGMSAQEVLQLCKSRKPLLRKGPWGTEHLVFGPKQTDSFSLIRSEIRGEMPMNRPTAPEVLLVLSGEGELECGGQTLSLRRADELFLPCGIAEAMIRGGVTLLRCRPGGIEY